MLRRCICALRPPRSSDDAFRPKAISLVLAGGIVAAIIGPSLATVGTDLLAPFTFAGSFLFVALLSAAIILPLLTVRFPQLTAAEVSGPQRPLAEILRQPVTIAALFAGVFGYSTMVFIMTATPLAMKVCGFGVGETAGVLSVHILGMFAPSFVTGHIIRRIGERRVLLAGAASLVATVAIGLAGIDILHFWFALVLLGIGWNFLFVGGTTLLTKCYRPAERAKMQGVNDFLTFTGVAMCSFIAGAVEQSWGWNAVLLGVLGAHGPDRRGRPVGRATPSLAQASFGLAPTTPQSGRVARFGPFPYAPRPKVCRGPDSLWIPWLWPAKTNSSDRG